MTSESGDRMLYARRAVVLPHDDGVIVKRGSTEFNLSGEHVAELTQLIFERCQPGLTPESLLLEHLSAENRQRVQWIIDRLCERRILEVVPDEESTAPEQEADEPEDILYWELGTSSRVARQTIEAVTFVCIGRNEITGGVIRQLAAAGARRIALVDDPALRLVGSATAALEQVDDLTVLESADAIEPWIRDQPGAAVCMVASSQYGGQHLLRRWNQQAADLGAHFFPVLFDRLVGYIGPLVVPGDSPCLECVRARENSHVADATLSRYPEHHADRTRRVHSGHPMLIDLVARLSGLELIKYYARLSPYTPVGFLLEVNLLRGVVKQRRVLRVPRCSVCSRAAISSSETPATAEFAGFADGP